MGVEQPPKNRRAKGRPLLCFPTELERRRFMALGPLPSELADVHVIGFGALFLERCAMIMIIPQVEPA